MKKPNPFVYCLCFILFTSSLFAQLFVKSGSYVYVKDKPLYVKDYVNLDVNANLYLRNGSQLFQDANATSTTNTGTGIVSVFQEGTVNNYSYNYWCSPVGKATTSTLINENFGITLLHRPTSELSSTVTEFATLYDGNASPLSISRRWIHKYITASGYSGWIYVGDATTIAPGEGFTMKGTAGVDNSFSEDGVSNNPGSAQRYDFRGKANNGNIPIVVAPGETTLTGNPYPSAINLQQFLLTGSANNPSAVNCTGIAYFWEQDKSVNSHMLVDYRGGYGAYAAGIGPDGLYEIPTFFAMDNNGNPITGSFGSGTDYPRKFSPIGQGFMIIGAPSASAPVVMQNKFRVYQKEGALVSRFEKTETESLTSNEWSYFRMNTKLNGQGVRRMTLAFNPNATDGLDHGMDAESIDSHPVDVFFPIENKECNIQSVAFDINKRIPMGFKTNVPAVFALTVSEIMDFDESQDIYLHDKIADTYHSIKNGLHEINLPVGVNKDQFEITFKTSFLNTESNSFSVIDVLQNNANQELTISNPALLNLSSVALYDVAGKLIFDKKNNAVSEKYTYSTAGISEGVYIVKIINSDKRDFSKKITVTNRK